MYLPLVIGAYISISLLKVPDLSIESAYATGAIFGGYMLLYAGDMPQMVSLFLVIIASCVGGAAVGLTSSLLTRKGKLPHLLSSIVTSGIFHGINQLISPVYFSLSGLGNPLFYGLSKQYPELLMLSLIVTIVGFFIAMLLTTQLGYAYAIYGNNPCFFKQYGISTAYVFITGVVLANALAGLSGYLFAQSNGFVELNMGYAKALFCITALILGKVMTKKLFFIGIPLWGTIAYFFVQQSLLKVGFNLKYFTAVQALLVAGILLYRYRYSVHHFTQDNLGI